MPCSLSAARLLHIMPGGCSHLTAALCSVLPLHLHAHTLATALEGHVCFSILAAATSMMEEEDPFLAAMRADELCVVCGEANPEGRLVLCADTQFFGGTCYQRIHADCGWLVGEDPLWFCGALSCNGFPRPRVRTPTPPLSEEELYAALSGEPIVPAVGVVEEYEESEPPFVGPFGPVVEGPPTPMYYEPYETRPATPAEE